MRPFSLRDATLELVVVGGFAAVAFLLLVRGRWLLPGTDSLRSTLLVVVFVAAALRARTAARAETKRVGLAPGRWLAGLGSPELVLGATFLCLLAILPVPVSAIGADAASQFEQLSDVLLRARLGSHPGLEPGVSVLWTPFFILGHLTALVAGRMGVDVVADGSSEPYRNAIRLGAVVYAFLAALLAHRACRRFFPPLFAAVCVAGVWLSSSLFHYTVAEPAMPHAPAAAVAALVLLLWLRAREDPGSLRRWAAVSFAGGLLFSIQRYDAYLLLGPALSGVSALRTFWRRETGARARGVLQGSVTMLLAFALATLPLVLLTLLTPERFLLSPEVARTTMLGDWSRPHVVEVLFSSNGGLFAWTPVALLSIIGFGLLARRDLGLGLSLLATVALGIYLLSSTPLWWAGWSYGARRMTEAFALLTLGFCAFSEAILRHPRVLGFGALGTLVGVNVLLSGNVRRGTLPETDAVSFSRAMREAVTDLYQTVGHPASWPANWLFAWRHGVSPDRFDELFGRIPRESWVVRAGSLEERSVLGRGWASGPLAQPLSSRWALGSESTMLLTLPEAANRLCRIVAAAAPHPQNLNQGLVVEVNGTLVARLNVELEGRSFRFVVAEHLWRPGLNEVRFRPAWSLSRAEAFASGVPESSAWRLEEFAVEPVEE